METPKLILMRGKFFIVTLFLCSLLLCALITEGILRIFYSRNFETPPWQIGERYLIDSNLVYKLTPLSTSSMETAEFIETATTNNFGMRNKTNITLEKPANTYRILLTGDSFTFGSGLKDNETISVQMEKILNESNRDITFEVLNKGVPGYSLDQEYRSLLEDIKKFHPDLVFWNLIPSNMSDSVDPGPSYRAILYDLLPNNTLKPLDATRNRLYVQNYLFLKTPRWLRNSYLFDALRTIISHSLLLSRIPNKDENELREWTTNKFVLEAKTIRDMCESYNCKLVVTWLPSKLDSPKKYIIPFPDNKLQNQKIETLNVENIIGINQSNYFPIDVHPNATGAGEIAKVFSKFISIINADKL